MVRPSLPLQHGVARPAQPGLLYLRGLSSDKVFSLTVERVPHTENVVRPLTFALELSVAEASEDLFMLRIAGAHCSMLQHFPVGTRIGFRPLPLLWCITVLAAMRCLC